MNYSQVYQDLKKELAACIARWRDGNGTGCEVRFNPETGEIDDNGKIVVADYEGFLAYCGDFTLAQVLDGETDEEAARKYLNLYEDELMDSLKKECEAVEESRLALRRISGITDAALVTDNADGLFLAVWAKEGCIYLADFSGNEEEAGKLFADIYTGRANIEKVCFWWEEGDFASDLAQLWGTDGSQAEVTCEHRRRILEGWEGEMEGSLKYLAPLTAGGGSTWYLEEHSKFTRASVSNTQLFNALGAANFHGYPVQD